MKKDKGGRPPNTKVKHIVPYIVKELKLSNASMVRKSYIKNSGSNVALNTIKKYLTELVEEGVLRKNIVSKRIFTYEVR